MAPLIAPVTSAVPACVCPQNDLVVSLRPALAAVRLVPSSLTLSVLVSPDDEFNVNDVAASVLVPVVTEISPSPAVSAI